MRLLSVCTVCEPNPCWVGDLTMHQLHMHLFGCFPKRGRIALTHNEWVFNPLKKESNNRWVRKSYCILIDDIIPSSWWFIHIIICSTSKHIFCHPSYAMLECCCFYFYFLHTLFEVQFLINLAESALQCNFFLPICPFKIYLMPNINDDDTVHVINW